MNRPQFSTAIPKRRYRLEGFNLVLLGDIDGRDPLPYAFILAAVPEGQNEPVLYVTSQRNRRTDGTSGSHALRLITATQETVLDRSDAWADLETFAGAALKVAASALGVGDAEPCRLL